MCAISALVWPADTIGVVIVGAQLIIYSILFQFIDRSASRGNTYTKIVHDTCWNVRVAHQNIVWHIGFRKPTTPPFEVTKDSFYANSSRTHPLIVDSFLSACIQKFLNRLMSHGWSWYAPSKQHVQGIENWSSVRNSAEFRIPSHHVWSQATPCKLGWSAGQDRRCPATRRSEKTFTYACEFTTGASMGMWLRSVAPMTPGNLQYLSNFFDIGLQCRLFRPAVLAATWCARNSFHPWWRLSCDSGCCASSICWYRNNRTSIRNCPCFLKQEKIEVVRFLTQLWARYGST